MIVIGGGIYGAMIAVQASSRKLRPLIVERDDFGQHTSFNSLRIIHGGLRYLQSFDIPRFFESVRERRWFLSEFPEFVRPLACLMPLYGRGLKRNSIMRVALAANDILSSMRNVGVSSINRLPRSRIIDKQETIRLFPSVATEGLRGAALWHDAALADSPQVIMELLNWAAEYGADILNYTEAKSLVTNLGGVRGLNAIDRITGERHMFNSPIVVNATGPWSDQTAAMLGAKDEPLFLPSLAWNLWMDRNTLSDCALAVTPERDGAPTYFLHPWKGRLLIGTGHAPWSGSLGNPKPSKDQVQHMLDDINLAIPGLSLKPENVKRIFAGLLPAREFGSAELSVRPQFMDHTMSEAPRGLFTVFGVKFTTSRLVASQALDQIFGRHPNVVANFRRPATYDNRRLGHLDFNDQISLDTALAEIRQLITDESIVHLSDLVLRRTDLWENPACLSFLIPSVCDLFSWDERQRGIELDILGRELNYIFE